VSIGDAWKILCLNAKARTNLAEIFDFGDIFVAHEQAGVLSLRDSTDL